MRATVFLLSLLLSTATLAADADQPIAAWAFDALPDGKTSGKIAIRDSDLVAPLYPGFEETNQSLSIAAPAYVKVASPTDTNGNETFDFKNGDSITVEAWVNLKSLSQHAYIIGKGRTETSGPKSIDQNWAVRFRKGSGGACLNFLFHSQAVGNKKSDWHRWTSTAGIGVGDGWHHVALSYTFGKPESIRGIMDGKTVKGKWDMGGATKQPPMSTDSPVWIGSAMAGNRSNSFDGQIDDLMVYRSIVDPKTLVKRFRVAPTPVVRPESLDAAAKQDRRVVVNELYGPIASINSIPNRLAQPRLTWQQNAMGFTRLPHHYDSWGVRDDWTGNNSKGAAMLVRSWTDVRLEPGNYRFMIRSRSYSRLFIDGQPVVATPQQRNRSGAHHVVDPLPEVPVAGMRPAFMNDHERVVDFHSDGGVHELRYDVIVGGPKYRLEFGETCVAVAEVENDECGMFGIVSTTEDYPLTDDGWTRFDRAQRDWLDRLDQRRRRTNAASQDEFWKHRHEYARQNLINHSDAAPITSRDIDQLISSRIQQENSRRAGVVESNKGKDYFTEHVRPILQSHCARCHGEKQQGGLSVFDRATLLSGGESGVAAVVPGKPAESQLLDLVSAGQGDYRMPPKGEGLTADEIAHVKKWIDRGATIPEASKPLIHVSTAAADDVFLRRVYIDTLGVTPTLAEVKAFLRDTSEQRRARVIDRLLDDPRWADNWVGYWQDALAENPNLLKPTLNNTGPFRYWIYEALRDNKPMDRFATELIQMRGSKWYGGAAGFSIASQNDVPMAAKAHVIGTAFMGVEMKCARCHDAPYHAWKQSDLFQLAAMLDRKSIKLPKSSTVPAAFFQAQERESLIKVTLKPGETIRGDWPFAAFTAAFPAAIDSRLIPTPDDSRDRLAAQVTASRRFAEVIANRVWKRLIGRGIVESVDDWQGNLPSDPKLLATLADALIQSDYDAKSLTRLIMNSRVYQAKAIDLAEDSSFFAAPTRRRMSAEQIVDTAFHSVAIPMRTEQLTLDVEGTLPADKFLNFGFPQRAWEFSTLANERDRPSLALPRVQAIADALQAFGWRSSRPEPTSQRDQAANLVQPGVLANGTLGVWLTRLSDDSGLTELALKDQSVESFVDDLFLTMLTREPSDDEKKRFVDLLREGYADRTNESMPSRKTMAPKRFRYVSWSNHLNTEANVIKVEMQQQCRKGADPTYRLKPQWRERAEDAVWALLNSPESVLVP